MKKIVFSTGREMLFTDWELQEAKAVWISCDLYECERLGVTINKKFIVYIETPNKEYGKLCFYKNKVAGTEIIQRYFYNSNNGKLFLDDEEGTFEIRASSGEKEKIEKNLITEEEFFHPARKIHNEPIKINNAFNYLP